MFYLFQARAGSGQYSLYVGLWDVKTQKLFGVKHVFRALDAALGDIHTERSIFAA